MLILEYGPICACLTNVELFPLHAQFIISCWVLRWGHMPWHYVCCVSAVIGFSLLDHFCTQAFRMLEDITHIFLSQTLNCLSRRPSLIFFLDMPLNKSSIFLFFFDERLIRPAYEPNGAGAVLFLSPSPPTVSVVVRGKLTNFESVECPQGPNVWATNFMSFIRPGKSVPQEV